MVVTPCSTHRRRKGVPAELRVEVGVDVDEAGRHDSTRGVDDAVRVGDRRDRRERCGRRARRRPLEMAASPIRRRRGHRARRGPTPLPPPTRSLAAYVSLLRSVTDGLDVVAVGIAHECAVVARGGTRATPAVRAALRHRAAYRGSEERPHRRSIGRHERDVRLAEPVTGRLRAEPEVGLVARRRSR